METTPSPDSTAPTRRSGETDADAVEPSVDELLGEIAHQLTVLMRSDFQLAAAERAPEIRQGARDMAAVAVAAATALLGFAAVSWAAVLGLSHVMASWGAALVVAGFWTVVTVLLLRSGGVMRLKARVGPERQEQALAAARAARSDAERAITAAAAKLGKALMRETAGYEMKTIVAAEQRIADTVERDVEAILRDLVGALSVPEKASGFFGRISGRGRD
jgi:hypothetical protein